MEGVEEAVCSDCLQERMLYVYVYTYILHTKQFLYVKNKHNPNYRNVPEVPEIGLQLSLAVLNALAGQPGQGDVEDIEAVEDVENNDTKHSEDENRTVVVDKDKLNETLDGRREGFANETLKRRGGEKMEIVFIAQRFIGAWIRSVFFKSNSIIPFLIGCLFFRNLWSTMKECHLMNICQVELDLII